MAAQTAESARSKAFVWTWVEVVARRSPITLSKASPRAFLFQPWGEALRRHRITLGGVRVAVPRGGAGFGIAEKAVRCSAGARELGTQNNLSCRPTIFSRTEKTRLTLLLGGLHFMKRILIPVLVITAFAGFVFAQGWSQRTKIFVDKNRPPPLSLPEAYAAAVAFVGPATNQFWCSGASCSPDYGTPKLTHWEFGFSNTNGETRRVYVLFDKSASLLDHGALVLPFR